VSSTTSAQSTRCCLCVCLCVRVCARVHTHKIYAHIVTYDVYEVLHASLLSLSTSVSNRIYTYISSGTSVSYFSHDV